MKRCRASIAQNWDDLIREGLAAEENKAAALKLLAITNNLKELEGATFVFGVVAEDPAQK